MSMCLPLGVTILYSTTEIKLVLDSQFSVGAPVYSPKASVYLQITLVFLRYMKSIAPHTGAPTVHCEDNTSYISVVESKIVIPRVKQIDILVYFLQEQFENGILITKYEKYSFVPADMCTKPCSGPIISRSIKRMTGFIFYPDSVTEHYQLKRLNDIVVN